MKIFVLLVLICKCLFMPREGIIRQMSWLFLRTRSVMPLLVLIVFLKKPASSRANQIKTKAVLLLLFCCCYPQDLLYSQIGCSLVRNCNFVVRYTNFDGSGKITDCRLPRADCRLQVFGSLLDSLQILIKFAGVICQVPLFKLPKRHLFGQESVC